MAWLPAASAGVGLLGDIFGGKQQASAQSQQEQIAQEAANNQQELINQGILPTINTMMGAYNQDFAPIQQGVSGQYGGALQNMNLGNTYSQVMNYLMNPQNTMTNQLGPQVIQGLGGIGQQVAGLSGETGQLANPLTQLYGQAGNSYNTLDKVAPGAMNLYEQTMKHGLSPSVIGNAYNNQQVQQQQEINNIQSQLGPQMANAAGAINEMQYNDAMSRAQLSSNLAAQNQGLMLQGAGAATGLGQQMGQDVQSQIQQQQGLINALQGVYGQQAQMAGQQAGLLGQEFGVGNTMDQLTQNMLQGGLGDTSNLLSQFANYANQGEGFLAQGLSGMENLANMYGQSAMGASQNMMNMAQNGGGWPNAMGNISNLIQNLPSGLFGGGSASAPNPYYSMPSGYGGWGSFGGPGLTYGGGFPGYG